MKKRKKKILEEKGKVKEKKTKEKRKKKINRKKEKEKEEQTKKKRNRKRKRGRKLKEDNSRYPTFSSAALVRFRRRGSRRRRKRCFDRQTLHCWDAAKRPLRLGIETRDWATHPSSLRAFIKGDT